MATAVFNWFGAAPVKILNKEVDFDTDTIVATLHTNSYTPNRDTHAYVSDLTNEVANGAGYTTGGKTLASKSISYVAANSWAQTAAVSTAYNVGEVRRPSTGNGFLYRVAVAGTSSGTAPTWPTTIGATVTDGGVTWTCVGKGAVMLDAADLSWTTFTATGIRHVVLSDRTPGTAATQPLLGIATFSADEAGGGGNWDLQFDAGGILVIFVP